MCCCSSFLIGDLLTVETLRQYPPLLLCVLYKNMRSVCWLISCHLGLDVKFCCLVAVLYFLKCICRFLVFQGTLVCLCVVLIEILHLLFCIAKSAPILFCTSHAHKRSCPLSEPSNCVPILLRWLPLWIDPLHVYGCNPGMAWIVCLSFLSPCAFVS